MKEPDHQAEVARLFAIERVPMVHLATLLVGSVAVAEALSLGGNDLLGPRPDGLRYIPAFVSPDGTGVLRIRLDHCQNS